VVAARGSMDSEWFAWLASVRRFRTPAVETSLAAPAKADVNRDIAKKLHRHGDYASRDDNPLLGKIVGERLYERSYPNAYRSADHLSRDLLQGATQEQATPFCDQLTTPTTTTGFMAARFNGGQMIAPPPPSSKRLQVTGKRS
jgi:hypothetical protein